VTVHVCAQYCYFSSLFYVSIFQNDDWNAILAVTEAAGKMQSVEELEARMRQQGLNIVQQNNNNIVQSSSNKNTEEDLVAFKNLVRN
jgi:hypothetical protein